MIEGIEEYLRVCGVKSVDDLSKEQVFAWAKRGKMGLRTKISVDIVENGLFGEKPDTNKALLLLKQAIKENKQFSCSYIELESCEDPDDNIEITNESFEMGIV